MHPIQTWSFKPLEVGVGAGDDDWEYYQWAKNTFPSFQEGVVIYSAPSADAGAIVEAHASIVPLTKSLRKDYSGDVVYKNLVPDGTGDNETENKTIEAYADVVVEPFFHLRVRASHAGAYLLVLSSGDLQKVTADGFLS